MSFRGLMNRTLTIQRKSGSPDGQGGHTLTYSDIGSTRGRIRPASSTERTIAEAWDALVSHVGYTPAGVDVRRDDRITTDNNGDTLYFRVKAVRNPSLKNHHLEIDLEQMQLDGDGL